MSQYCPSFQRHVSKVEFYACVFISRVQIPITAIYGYMENRDMAFRGVVLCRSLEAALTGGP